MGEDMMTIKDLYEKIGADYDEALSRMQKEERMIKYVGLFINDTSFNDLKMAMEDDNMEEAFKAAHTLKGLCANLSFKKMFIESSDLTEALRNNTDIAHAKEIYPKLLDTYLDTISNIKNFLYLTQK